MKILTINNTDDAKKEISAIDCTTEGINMMAEKAVFRVIKLSHITTKAANILKQSMLSKGGEAAISRYCADLSREYTDVILMGTLKQYRAVIPILMIQPWGLKKIAADLKRTLGFTI
ncbi:dihydropteroate synthase [Pectinatus sottacetonis]|uniref:dihydropteroate synthase n=1 Tax=Pectinatus sottacetonis TaxID=1002795 RepID=UPI0018C6ADAD|nr:dihydropteroate synthase [Pectinatus sottacetonis]